ncbi:MAG: SGNH/GDSL hydrolase family protein, partial [Lewinella sp.]
HILPTGSEVPAGVDINPDPERNITEALNRNPAAVIINMPSNDAANGISAEDQLANFATIVQLARDSGVAIWVATTQPRNFGDAASIDVQREVRDSILSVYGDRSIDFWTGLATSAGTIEPLVDSGDGVHVNNIGHDTLYRRVVGTRMHSFVKQTRKAFADASLPVELLRFIAGRLPGAGTILRWEVSRE